MKTFGIFVAFLLVSVLSLMYSGYAFSVLWGWFVVPLGLPSMGVATSIGLYTLVSFSAKVVDMRVLDTRDTVTKISNSVGLAIVYPSLVLLVGWIAKGYV